MPGRDANRSKKTTTPDPSARLHSRQDAAAPNAEALIADLQQQRDRLNGELAAARARIVELEAARDQTLDRIAWVIDSLHNGLDK